MATSKKTKVTAVVAANTGELLVPTNPKEVSITIAQLEEQLKILKGGDSEKADLEMSLNGTKIKDMTKVGQLLRASSNVFAQEKAYNDEIKRYKLEGMNIKPFGMDGRTVDKWEKAILFQINSVINKTQIDKITNAINELKTHLTEKEKLANTLAGITGSVSGYIE